MIDINIKRFKSFVSVRRFFQFTIRQCLHSKITQAIRPCTRDLEQKTVAGFLIRIVILYFRKATGIAMPIVADCDYVQFAQVTVEVKRPFEIPCHDIVVPVDLRSPEKQRFQLFDYCIVLCAADLLIYCVDLICRPMLVIPIYGSLTGRTAVQFLADLFPVQIHNIIRRSIPPLYRILREIIIRAVPLDQQRNLNIAVL